MPARPATSSSGTATTTPRRSRRWTSGQRRGTCCSTPPARCRATRTPGRPIPRRLLGVPLRALWQMGLWAVVLPAILLLVLLRRTVERIEPGLGTAAAVTLGLGTLMLPFSTMLFAHVPAALLAFLSFALLFERDAGPWRIAAAGAAAGLAISTDAPLAAPAVLLGLYAASRVPHLRRLAFVRRRRPRRAPAAPRLRLVGVRHAVPPRLFGGAPINPGAGGVELSPRTRRASSGSTSRTSTSERTCC